MRSLFGAADPAERRSTATGTVDEGPRDDGFDGGPLRASPTVGAEGEGRPGGGVARRLSPLAPAGGEGLRDR